MLFFSGGSALVFQVAWMRELRLVFGATTAAVAAVLAIFMAGLGLGSAVLGLRADRVANPLRMYGILETAVALSVAVSPLMIWLAASFYFRLGGQESMGLHGATVARLLLAAAVMGLPTFLMGGTLPAAVRSITTTGDARRRGLAVLYGVNTLGAVCGAYFATFFALEFLGTRATLWFGCAMNLLVGVTALSLSRRMLSVPVRGDASGGEAATQIESSSSLLYMTAAVLGFTFFTLELVWYRMLAPILGGTTFTFGLILCMALLGIGIGGASYHFVFRWVRPSWPVLALTCAAEAALAAFPLALGDRLALFAGRWFMYSATFSQVEAGWCIVMAIVVLPVALVSGLQFPLLVAMLGQGRAAVSRQLGTAYAWNTVGAIAGSLVGGFGALPLLTAPGTWRAASMLLAMLSLVLVARSWREAGWRVGAVATLLLLAIVFVSQPGPTAVWRHSGIGAGRAVVPAAGDVNATLMWCNEQRRNLQWEAEGIESSIGITAPDGLSFVVNGKNDGNSIGDAGTQIGVAIIGAALHPEPKQGLVIGLGTGESAGWLASMPGIERVDVVELEPAIDEMARRSSSLNRNALAHPKVRRIYNDGREHVFTTGEKYDVILSEPSNPYRAGVASLYTQEFYGAVRDRMTKDGIFVQWVQAYEVDGFTVSTVLATARSVFNHVEVWQTIPGDLQLVCSQTPIAYSAAELRKRIAEPVMQEALRIAWNVRDLEGFLAHFLGTATFVDKLVQDDALTPNTDDRNFLEYGFAKTVGMETGFSGGALREAALNAGQHRPQISFDEVDWDLVEKRRTEFNWQFNGNLEPFAKATPEQRARMEGYIYFSNGKYREALDKWSTIRSGSLSDIERLVQGRAYAELGDATCLELIAPVETSYPSEAAAIRAVYYWKQKDTPRAGEAAAQAFESLAQNPWSIATMIDPLVRLTTEIADADHAAGRRFLELLKKPYAGVRYEHRRKLLRLLVAESLGREYVLEALEALEPNPPWMGQLLKMRAEVYAAAKHPLAERAQRDWELYERHDK
jgi:predicted membrane-bound spermidine synthase